MNYNFDDFPYRKSIIYIEIVIFITVQLFPLYQNVQLS